MNNVCDPIAGAGELALRKHGLDGDRLLNMAYAIANAYARRTGSGLDSRIDDLAQHLALTATRKALGYEKVKDSSYTFTSYLWDIMEHRCVDWHRRKAEGFGDARYGHDNRVDLTDEADAFTVPPSDVDPAVLRERHDLADEHDRITRKRRQHMATLQDVVRLNEIMGRLQEITDDIRYARWRYASWAIQQEFSRWTAVTEPRILRWQRAADKANLPLDGFITVAADLYAQQFEKQAA